MYSRLQSVLKRPFLVWFCFWLAVSILYLPAWKGGFQQDFHGWLQMYTDEDFLAIINRNFAKIPSLYQLTQLQLYGWTWLFGTHPLPWYLLFTALHALNGMLLFRFSSRLFQDFKLPKATWIALAGTLLFLFNPSMTEAVLWKAAYHYPIAIQIVLWMLIWTQRYLHTQAYKWVYFAAILFLLSTLTLEIWYTIPAILFLLIVAYLRAGLVAKRRATQALGKIFLPTVLIFIIYLLAYHARYGLWVAHGAYSFPEDHKLFSVVGRTWSYEFHLLFAGRFFSNDVRSWVYQTLASSHLAGLTLLLIVAGFALYAYARFPNASARFRVVSLFLGWTVISLAIILHFLPSPLMLVNNDRYLYFTALFQYMIVAVLMGALLPSKPKLWMSLTAALLLIYTSLTAYTVWQWRQSTKIFWGIQSNFRWQKAPLVLLLNMPTTYNGVGIVIAGETEDFAEHLRIYHHQANNNTIKGVVGYNMQHPWDGAHVTVQDSLHVKVTLNQWGSWWTYNALGATSYENEYFAVNMTDQGHEYILSLKHKPEGTVLLYQQGMQWRVVDMKKIGVEQW